MRISFFGLAEGKGAKGLAKMGMGLLFHILRKIGGCP
jgi:hypothetical protein